LKSWQRISQKLALVLRLRSYKKSMAVVKRIPEWKAKQFTRVGRHEQSFIAQRDSFYMATSGENGFPIFSIVVDIKVF
jgi:hypothetical protein